jgi:hypothetical protein
VQCIHSVALGECLSKSGIMQTKKEVQNSVCRRLLHKFVAFTLMGNVGK